MYLINLIEKLPWLAGVLLVISLFVTFAVVGILIIRRFFSTEYLKRHHDVAGFVFTNLGVLYSVLLGFTVVNVQQRFDKITENAQIEASYIAELYRNSEVFQEDDRKKIQQALKNYAEHVINNEWKTMSLGEENPDTVESLRHIWKAYYSMSLSNKMQEIWYAESVNRLNLLMSARISRVLGGEQSLGGEMWTLLIFGGVLIVTFIWFFGLESQTTHILMASVLAASTAFLLFLIYSLDTAFTGEVSIQPEAMQRVLSNIISNG